MDKKKVKNIAFYIGDFRNSGGTERVCISIINELANKTNLSITLITTNNKNETSFFKIDPKVNVLYLNITNLKRQYLSLFFKLNKVLVKNEVDVLVSVESMSLIFTLPVYLYKKVRKKNIKLIVWEHFNFTVNLGKKLRDSCRRWAAKYADTIVVLTKRDVELWTDNLTVKGKILNINNPSPFTISNKEYNTNSKNIIAVGRLTYQKGFDRLLDIWVEFIQLTNEDWKLQIIGDGPDRGKLEEQIKQLGIAKSVELVGSTSNIQWYYENASLLVMTSRFEGLPMTLIEAKSFGLPIIAYDCLTGPAEIVSTNSGIIVEETNSKSFVKQLITICEDKNKRLNMSKYAKLEVFDFSLDNAVNNWMNRVFY